MTLASCTESKLQKIVESTNADCPISMGSLGEATSMTLEDGMVVFTYSIDESYVDIDALRENQEASKASVLSALCQNSKEMFAAMKEENAGLILKYIGKTSKKTFIIKISADECQAALSSIEKGESDSPAEFLKKLVNTSNVQCPMTIDEGLVIYELTIEGDYVVYNVNVDETLYNIDNIKENAAQTKETIKSTLIDSSDKAVVHFINACKNAKKGVAYKYIGSTSGESYQINIPLYEL